MLFEKFRIGKMELVNRVVRSATADTDIAAAGRITELALNRYETLAQNSVGMIITGDFSVVNLEMLEDMSRQGGSFSYEKIMVEDLAVLPGRVHGCSDAKLIAQISNDLIYRIPSYYDSFFSLEDFTPATAEEIDVIIKCFVKTALLMEERGFDGVQIHAAHGGLLSMFLSPWTNRREDAYGGSVEGNCLIIRRIVEEIKRVSPDFPVLLKMNSTDYIPGGIGADNLQAFASELESAGIDAVEFSGGMWESLCMPEDGLGFKAVPAAESHTEIDGTEKQSYFRKFTAPLKLGIPRILVGGNRSLGTVEDVLERGEAELISFCRPFICEPDFIARWAAGEGAGVSCISCNACIYDMWFHPGGGEEREVICLYNKARKEPQFKKYYTDALVWRDNWVAENRGK